MRSLLYVIFQLYYKNVPSFHLPNLTILHIFFSFFSVRDHCHRARSEGVDLKARRKLIIASILCLVFMIAEIVGEYCVCLRVLNLLTDWALCYTLLAFAKRGYTQLKVAEKNNIRLNFCCLFVCLMCITQGTQPV